MDDRLSALMSGDVLLIVRLIHVEGLEIRVKFVEDFVVAEEVILGGKTLEGVLATEFSLESLFGN